MADLTITVANSRVETGALAYVAEVVAGEAVSPMQTAYKKASDSKYYKALNATSEAANCAGIFLSYGSANDTVLMLKTGVTFKPGATVVLGETYYVSDNAGGIAPSADIGTGDYVTKLGIGVSTSEIKLDIDVSGVAKP